MREVTDNIECNISYKFNRLREVSAEVLVQNPPRNNNNTNISHIKHLSASNSEFTTEFVCVPSARRSRRWPKLQNFASRHSQRIHDVREFPVDASLSPSRILLSCISL